MSTAREDAAAEQEILEFSCFPDLAEALPLSPIVDFLCLPLGLPEYWPWQSLWSFSMAVLAAYWGWSAIRKKIFL